VRLQPNRGLTSTVAMLMLFTFFGLLSLLQVLYGARVYERVVSRMEDGHNLRASLSYVTNKLHAHDGMGPITVEQANALPVLCLWAENGETVTCIYFTNGALYEQLLDPRTLFLPEAGQEIARLADFTFVEDGGAYTFSACTFEGTMRRVTVRLRSPAGGAP